MSSISYLSVTFISCILFWIANLNGSDGSTQPQHQMNLKQLNEDILKQINIVKNMHPSNSYLPKVYAQGYHPTGPPAYAYGPSNYHRPNKYGFGMVPMTGLSDPCHTYKIPQAPHPGTNHSNAKKTKACYALCAGRYGFSKTGLCVPALGCRCFSHKLKPKLWLQELMQSPTGIPGMYYRSTKDKKSDKKLEKEAEESAKVEKS